MVCLPFIPIPAFYSYRKPSSDNIIDGVFTIHFYLLFVQETLGLSHPSSNIIDDVFTIYSRLLFIQKTMGLSHPSGSIVDGVFTCKWTRAIEMPGQNMFADLHNEYYILVGSGPVSGGTYSWR